MFGVHGVAGALWRVYWGDWSRRRLQRVIVCWRGGCLGVGAVSHVPGGC